MRTYETTALLLLAAGLSAGAALAQSWEKPRAFEASQVLTADQAKGDHHSVDDVVTTHGYYYAFTLHTDFGDLKPAGLDLLRKRIRETEALEALEETSKSSVFVQAAGRSLESTAKGTLDVVTDPVGTVKGLGAGIKRFGHNLGRKTKRAVQSAKGHSGSKGKESMGETAETVANSALGVNRSARMWAQKLQVDPYSRNPTLQKALIEIAQIDAAGGLAARVAVPIPMAVSATAKVGDLVWGKDPEELRRANEAALGALGVSPEVAARFLHNEHFTPTDQTRFVAALAAVKADGLADYVDSADGAENPRLALFFVESAEMLARHHGHRPVEAVLTDSRTMVARSGRRAVALLPLDYVAWMQRPAEAAKEIAERAKEELGATSLEIRLTGQASPRARQELARLGWALKEHVPGADAPGPGSGR